MMKHLTHVAALLAAGLSSIFLWHGALIMPDGRVARLIGPSPAMDSGIKIDDYVVIIDGKTFDASRTRAALPDARYIIVRRGIELVPIMNPKAKGR